MTGSTRAATGRREGHSRLADADLIPLVVEGDTRAFAALYDRHGRAAHSLATG